MMEAPPATGWLALRSLQLHAYRNYGHLSLDLEPAPVVLAGANGAGKTNVLEAVSFLSPGRGLRGVPLQSIDMMGAGQPWAIASVVGTAEDEVRLGTGRDALSETDKRRVHVNGQPVRSQQALAEYLSIIWLTPAMDGLFMEAASARRAFWDRIVYSFFPGHASNVQRYQHAMRERNRLLAMHAVDARWLDAVEAKLAEAAIAVAAARVESWRQVTPWLSHIPADFPLPEVSLRGEVEESLMLLPALAAEEALRERLINLRSQDRLTGRTGAGVHRSDLGVVYTAKNQPAHACSTGEQKALMLSLLLAVVRARRAWTGLSPILLLDEVVAHLDSQRRASLCQQIVELKVQAWMTGTDASLFEALSGKAQMFQVQQASVMRVE